MAKKSYWIGIISIILISTAGASFNNLIRTFLEKILMNLGISSKLTEDLIIFFIFLVILLVLGFGFRRTLKRIIKK